MQWRMTDFYGTLMLNKSIAIPRSAESLMKAMLRWRSNSYGIPHTQETHDQLFRRALISRTRTFRLGLYFGADFTSHNATIANIKFGIHTAIRGGIDPFMANVFEICMKRI